MLPKRLRFRLFEILSLKTMRYVHAIPRRKDTGLVAQLRRANEERMKPKGPARSAFRI